MIDPGAGSGEAGGVLPNPETSANATEDRPKARRSHWYWIILGLSVLGLAWANGPGFRWIVPYLAHPFLERAGLRGDFEITGSVSHGFSISNLQVQGDKALAALRINRLTPNYHLASLVRGRIDGLTLDGAHLDWRLGMKHERESVPVDLGKWVEELRAARTVLIPVALAFRGVSLSATREGVAVVRLAGSRLRHLGGSDQLTVDLGVLTNSSGREWPAQRVLTDWRPDGLFIPRIDPLPGVSLRDFVLRIPVGSEPSVTAELRVADAVLAVTGQPGFSAIEVTLNEGGLEMSDTAKLLGFKLPGTARVTSLDVKLDHVFPDPGMMQASLTAGLENGVWRDWRSNKITVSLNLGHDRAGITARGRALETDFSLEADAPVTRGRRPFGVGDLQGNFNISDVPGLFRQLAPSTPIIDPEAGIPASSVSGSFKVSMVGNQPQTAAGEFLLKPDDDTLACPIAIQGRWSGDRMLNVDLTTKGLVAAATYQLDSTRYEASLGLDDFTSSRMERWLSWLRVKPAGTLGLTGKWSGNGEVRTGQHRGMLSLAPAVWSGGSSAPVTAAGSLRYDWPTGFNTEGLHLQMSGQAVALKASLANGLLEITHWLWSDGGVELAEGSASLPVPGDFSKWRDFLAKDARPVALSIKSRVLSLGLLKPWIPAMEVLDPQSTGGLNLRLSGTYAAPRLEASLELKNLRLSAQPELPPADLKLVLEGSDGRLTLVGSATTPDFPAAEVKASMAFRPAEWAETPGRMREEALEARVDLPRVDLSHFSSLIPDAERVSGTISGQLTLAGPLGKPDLNGAILLDKGSFSFERDRYPAIEAASANIEVGLNRLTLKSLTATLAGGRLQGTGSLAISEGKLGEIDLRLRGNHLPLIRNEVLILRTDADLRLQGPWKQVSVSGTVGIVDSIFYRDIELLPIGVPFTTPRAAALPKIDRPRRVVSSIPAPFRDWPLNVRVGTDEPLLIRGNLANGMISGSVRVGGTLGAPAPDGSFQLKGGRAALPFSTLSVRTGTATFTPTTGFDPILEIRGIAEPRPYQVTVYAYGRASDPQLVLTSNPPLPENEIMTLLATGATTAGLESPEVASSRALQLLVEELRRGRFKFGKQLRPLLERLDRFDFSLAETDPYSSESFSTATLNLTDHWLLSAGMAATGDSRMLAIWRMSFR